MVGNVIVASLLCLWTALTVGLQVPGLRNRIRRLDVFLLLPEYRFFAPNPIQYDYHLLYQDEFGDGSVSGWTEVCKLPDRRVLDVVWNPRKRERKALLDAVNLLSEISQVEGIYVPATTPYLLLLNKIDSMPRTYSAQRTRFRLMVSRESRGSYFCTDIFVSDVHRLTGAPAPAGKLAHGAHR